MTGNELFVKALQKEGIDYLFAYPGGYAIDIFDELYKQDSIQVILPRHEQGLIHAADGYARATGRTGVCLVTSGPGATNLVTGIATANYDSVPLVCFTGQVPTNLIGNDAFQEVDIVGITRGICKYAVTVRNRNDLGRIIKEAFYIANTGKKGPVLIDLPKDIMLQEGDEHYPKEVHIRGYKPSSGVHMGQLKSHDADERRQEASVPHGRRCEYRKGKRDSPDSCGDYQNPGYHHHYGKRLHPYQPRTLCGQCGNARLLCR